MLTIEKIDNEERLRQLLETKWNELLQRSSNNSVFLTWEWITTWLEIFKVRDELLLLSVRDEGGNLVGIAPFKKKIRKILGIKMRYIEFIGSGEEVVPDHLGFIILSGFEKETLSAIFDYFEKEKEGWDVINLTDMKEDTKILEIIRMLSDEKGYYINIKNDGICPYIKLPKTWEEYLNGLSRKSRYNVGKKRKNLSNDYKMDFFIWKDREKLNEIMSELSKLHQIRMLKKRTLGKSTKPKFWFFHNKIAKNFFDKGWFFLGVLKADNKIIACQYASRYNNKLFHYQSGIDPDYSKYSVGLISTTYMIEEAIKEGLTEYDFLRGGEGYKFHWANNCHHNIRLNIWNKNLKAKLLMFFSLGVTFLRSLKNKIRVLKQKGINIIDNLYN